MGSCLPYFNQFLFLPLPFSQITLVQLKLLRGEKVSRGKTVLLLLPSFSWRMSTVLRQMERRGHVSVPESWEWAAVYMGDPADLPEAKLFILFAGG